MSAPGSWRWVLARAQVGLGASLAALAIAAALSHSAAAALPGTAPQITITVPSDGGVYARGAVLIADYACTDHDGSSPVIGCPGSVIDGGALDSDTLGVKSFTVQAEDRDGNTSTKTVSYTIADLSAPTISVAAPQEDGSTRLRLNQVVAAGFGCSDDDGPEDILFCVGTAALGTPIATSVPGNAIFTVNASDLAGNAAQKHVPYFVDASPPAITIATPAAGVRLRRDQVVPADYACTDPDDVASPSFIDVTTCAGQVADGAAIATGAPGTHSFTVDSDDRAGNAASKTVQYVVDASAPQISIATPADGSRLRQGQVVLADYACTDEDGPADVSGCPGNARDGDPIDASTPGMKSFSVGAEDRAGNRSEKTVHYVVDASAPHVAIAAPADGGSYARGALVIADFACVDDDGPTDVQSCAGTVATDAAIDTSTPGEKSFTVEATDRAGNARSKTVTYAVVDSSGPPPPANMSAGAPPPTALALMGAPLLPPTLAAPRPGAGGTVGLTFTFPSAGVLSVVATTIVGGTTRVLPYAKDMRVVRAGVVQLTLRPATAARRLLKRRKQLKVKIRAVFAAAADGKQTPLTRSTVVRARR